MGRLERLDKRYRRENGGDEENLASTDVNTGSLLSTL